MSWLEALARQAAARLKTDTEHTYFMTVGDLVKVGYSKDPLARVTGVRYGGVLTPDGYDLSQLALLGSIPGGRWVEDRVHMLLHDFQVVGEWFRLDEPVVRVIAHLLYGEPLTPEWQNRLWSYLPERNPALVGSAS